MKISDETRTEIIRLGQQYGKISNGTYPYKRIAQETKVCALTVKCVLDPKFKGYMREHSKQYHKKRKYECFKIVLKNLSGNNDDSNSLFNKRYINATIKHIYNEE